MEGFFWFVIFILFVRWIVNTSRDRSTVKKYQEHLDSIPEFTVSIDKNASMNLKSKNLKSFAVKLKGYCGNPYGNEIKIILFAYDNTDIDDDTENGPPLLSAHEAFSDSHSRCLCIQQKGPSEEGQYWPKFFTFFHIPKEIIIHPHKGKRKLKFLAFIAQPDVDPKYGGFSKTDYDKIIHASRTIIEYNFTEVGYKDMIENQDEVQDLTIQLAMGMAASDGHLDQKELDILKKWVQNEADLLEKKAAKKRNQHFSKFIKETYQIAQNKELPISKIVKQFNEMATKSQKYEAIQLLLDTASADDKFTAEEDKFINQFVIYRS